MKDIENLYCAYIRFPRIAGEIEFKYKKMEIKQRYERCIETVHSYFTSSHYSTSYFEKDMLNKDLRINDELKVFYSESKEKCIIWLTSERANLFQSVEHDYVRLKESKIEEEVEI